MLRRYPVAVAFTIAFAAWAALAFQALAEEAPSRGAAAGAGLHAARYDAGREADHAAAVAFTVSDCPEVLARLLRSGPAVTVSGRRLPATASARGL
jgi:hypothetical protein